MRNIIENKLYQNDIQCCLKQIVNLKELADKSILITGATGLIGSFIVDTLYIANSLFDMNIKIYALGRDLERLKLRFNYSTQNEIFFIEHDVRNVLNIDIRIDYIIHAASNAYPAIMYADPVGTIMANLNGTYNLLNYLKKVNGKRLLFVSSGEIYGESIDKIDSFVEDYNGFIDILNIRSSYPLSKRCAENLCISFSKQFNLETVIVRPCHTYGPNNTRFDNRANVQFINKAINNEDIVLKSKGLQIRSYEYIADSISGLLTVLINGKNGEAYNLSNNKSMISIAEFAQIVAEIAGVKVVYDIKDIQPSPFSRAVLDGNKLEKLGWKAEFGIRRGIKHTFYINKNRG